MIVEFADLNLNLKGTLAGANSVPAAAIADLKGRPGKLVACWRPEVGQYGHLLIIRTFEDPREWLAERRRILTSSNPFGCADALIDLSFEAYEPYDGFGEFPVGSHGPFFEIRSYKVKPGGLHLLRPEWSAVKAERDKFSPMMMVMNSIDGPTRAVSMWPYKTLEERAIIRAKVFLECKGWPTPSGASWFDPARMTNSIYVAVDGSPLS